VTDHRIKESWSNMPKIMQGGLDPMLDALAAAQGGRAVAEGEEA
jgi:protein subunit release factor A